MTRTLPALLLTLAALLGTAACGDDGPDANEPATESQTPAPIPS